MSGRPRLARSTLVFAGLVAACAWLAVATYRALLGTALSLPWPWPDAPITFEHPERAALLWALPVSAWIGHRSLTALPARQRGLAFALRALLLLSLALALCKPTQPVTHARVSLVYALDVSDSVSDTALERAQAHIRAGLALAEGRDADVQVVTFAERAQRLEVEAVRTGPIGRHAQGGKTAPDRALQLAYGLLRPERLHHLVLLSDGRETHGDLLAEASRAAQLGVRIDTVPMREPPPPEVAIARVALPDEAETGESFLVRVQLHSTQPCQVTLRLYQDGALNPLDPSRSLSLEPGQTEVAFKSLSRMGGSVRYRAELTPSCPDRFVDNNRLEAATTIRGRPRVLLVDREPSHLRHLAGALTSADFEVSLRSPEGIPRSLSELSAFDFYVLSDVPAERVSQRHVQDIERYVRDVGGGFLMTGGAQGFGLGGYANTPMEDLLPVRMDTDRHRDEHSLALSLVIDTSGSMAGRKIALAKEAAKASADLLGEHDSIEVIGFSSSPQPIVRMQTARNRGRIARDIGRLVAQGGTAIFPALDAAYRDLSLVRARVKHVILLTDGQTPETGIPELAQAMRAEGITVSTVGLGDDVNRSLLQSAANMGAGRAYFTNDPSRVPRIFMRETSTVTRSNAVEQATIAIVQTPADFMAGIPLARAPLLRGYVATAPKPTPAQVLLVSELAEPILARTRLGLGWSLAWTSDLHPRWAASWLGWSQFGRFVGQLVRAHMRKPAHETLPLTVSSRGDRVRVTLDALDGSDRFINGLSSEVRVSGPLGSDQRTTTTLQLRQVAPGRYAGEAPISGYGAFAVEATHRREDRVVARSTSQLLRPYPEEYAQSEPDLALLTSVAALSGGRFDIPPGAGLEPRGDRVTTRRDLWPWLAGLAVLVYLSDIFTRRWRPRRW